MSSGSRSAGHITPSDESSSEQSGRTFQTVFRVSPPGEKPRQVYHPRRSHTKSRGGCLTCKKRRVKCDEQKPECVRCTKRKMQCVYASETELVCSKTSESSSSPDSTFFSLSLDSMTKKIFDVLGFDAGSTSVNRQLIPHRSLIPLAFNHFVNVSTETIPNPGLREKMGTDMIRISFDNAHLMYTILAVGMLHFNRVSPDQERSLAESYFWQKAINLYQKELTSNVTQENVDALLSSCMFMGVATVCPENFKPEDSWVLTNKPQGMNWLCLQSGLRCILALSKPFIPNSIWASAFAEIGQEEGDMFELEGIQGRDGLDPDLADLCGIDDYTTENNNVYYAPALYLKSMMLLEHTPRKAWQCATFMGRLECGFLDLARVRDPAALILLSNWMGLMCLLSQWQPWVEGRIRKECVAICMFLEQSSDPRVLRLLQFPALSCGYELMAS